MILIACGMQTEASILNAPQGAIVVQGRNADADLRGDLEAAIAKGGIGGVLSVGVSGALAPSLHAGDIVVAMMATDGVEACPGGADWQRNILRALEPPAFAHPSRSGVFGYSPGVVATSGAKARLRKLLSADVVDMETWVAASVAKKHALPFAAIRAISDPADFDMPPAALAAMTPSGAIDVGAVIGSLGADFGQIADLMKLGDYSGLAFTNLAAAMLAVGPRFGFPGNA